jgi:hypothetical protein
MTEKKKLPVEKNAPNQVAIVIELVNFWPKNE